jgi:hypothetical protein
MQIVGRKNAFIKIKIQLMGLTSDQTLWKISEPGDITT